MFLRVLSTCFIVLLCSSFSFAKTQQLFAPTQIGGSDFGWSSATDGQTFVVGAKSENSDAGAVYVYQRNDTNWDYAVRLEPNSVDPANEEFGYSVAVDGDTIVVGARGYNNDQGAIYIFEKDVSNGWEVDPVRIVAVDGQAGDWLGFSVAIDSDTIAAGAYKHNDEKGAVYVYEYSGGNWDLDAKLYDPDSKAKGGGYVNGACFGYSVDLDGDVIVVGARYDYTNYQTDWRRGAACVFRCIDGTWDQSGMVKLIPRSQKLVSSGYAVAVSGDVITVGSPFYQNGEPIRKGLITIYRWNGSQWLKEADLVSPGEYVVNSLFGRSLSLDGDRLATGEYNSDGFTGSAFLFEWDGGSWSSGTDIVPGGGASGDRLGCSVAISGDVIFVGAYKVDGDVADVGVVYADMLPEKVFNEFQVNTFTYDDQTNPAVAFNSDGEFVVVWRSDRQDSDFSGIYGQKYNKFGLRIGSEFRVSSSAVNMRYNSDIAFCPDGGFVVAWKGYDPINGEGDIYIRKFDSNCIPLTNDARANSYRETDQSYPHVAFSGGILMVGWKCWIGDPHSGDKYTKLRTFDSQLNPLVSEVTISGGGGWEPQIKADGQGNFLVLWHEAVDAFSSTAYIQKFSSLVQPLGTKKHFDFADSREFSFYLLPSGDYMLVWEEEVQGNNDASLIKAQKYSAAGAMIGSEIIVTDSIMDKRGVEFRVLSNGNFVVTWSGKVDTDFDIFAKEFDGNGIAISSEKVINSYTAGSQNSASIASTVNGRYLIAWASDAQDGDKYGVYAAIGPATYLGDFDFNGQIDIADLLMLAQRWLSNEPVLDIAPDGGDGIINLLDFSRLLEE